MPKLSETKKAERQQEMREKMRAGMLRLLASHSEAEITMEMLAQEIGVAKGSIYNYYPSKQILVNETLVSIEQQIGIAIAEVSVQPLPPDQKILAYVTMIFEHYSEYRRIYSAIYDSNIRTDFHSDEHRRNVTRLCREFSREIARGCELRIFWPQQNAEATGQILYSSVVGMIRLLFFGQLQYPPEQCVKMYREVVIQALTRHAASV